MLSCRSDLHASSKVHCAQHIGVDSVCFVFCLLNLGIKISACEPFKLSPSCFWFERESIVLVLFFKLKEARRVKL